MNVKKLIFLSLLVSAGLVLSIVENMIPIPIPVPGVKLGLANMVFLITLVILGYKEALLVVIIRSIILSIVIGNISGLMYSVPSSIMSTTIMAIIYNRFNKKFSLMGVSIFGALAYNMTQIGVASLIMQNIRIFSYLPIMNLMSLFTGYFIGLGSKFTIDNIKLTFGGYLK